MCVFVLLFKTNLNFNRLCFIENLSFYVIYFFFCERKKKVVSILLHNFLQDKKNCYFREMFSFRNNPYTSYH